MSENTPLYNSRITKIYLEYLNKTYPELDIDYILKYAEMTSDEVEDQAHWFSQHQVDRFQEAVIQKTGNINIAREAGRYAASSEAIGVAKHYMLGLLNLTTLYMLIGRVYSIFSRAVTIKAKKIGQNKVEIISTPMPGVNEKPYQCENRAGMFESVAKLFNVKFANIEHSLCFHRGDSCCRYIISWDKRPSLVCVTARNYFIIFAPIFFLIFYFFVSFKVLIPIAVLIFLIITWFSFVPLILEKKELTKTIETQGNLSKDLLDEMSIRHNNALLIQEIGQATSSILDIDVLLNAVINSMKTHMDFDRGLIMLSNPDKTMLIFKAGYGYTEEKEKVLQKTEFHLDNPKSKGVFVLAHKNKEPFLISNFSEIEKKLSAKSLEFAREMEAESLICTPIIYEKESLGILAVDNIKSKRQLTKSDLSFIMGVASQMAISIVNARYYQRLQESEKKYRELVENANSIIMRVDRDNKITFFNEYAQNFFGFTENEILGKSLEDTIFKNTEITMRDPNITQAYLSQKSQIQIISESKTGEENIKKEWIAWTYKPIFNESGQLLESLYIGNDITELKIAELEKKELEARLQRAQKMEAIGMLAGGVAHDLNNVLSGIVSYPELIIMDLPPNSPLLRPISTIQKAGERAAAIVQDLLTLARRGVVTTKAVNLNIIISDYLKSPEYANLITHHPNVKVTINLQKNLLNIVGSPIHLSKTIMNLVTNAVEAISNSGEITIITENLYVDKNIN